VKQGIPVLYHPPYSPDLAPADSFLCPKLKIAMKGTRFEAVSSIQQIVTGVLKAIREEAFLGHSIRCMSDVNVVRKRARTMLTDGINKYFFFIFCVVFMVSVRELNCHTSVMEHKLTLVYMGILS
jgi:hypothetical protein